MPNTVTGPTVRVVGGRRHYRWTVVETLVSQTTEFVLDGAPPDGTVTLYRAALTTGTGTTLNPRLGRVAGFALAGNDWIGSNNATAGTINDGTNLRYGGLIARKIWCRSYPNDAAADHTVLSEIEVVEGHDV